MPLPSASRADRAFECVASTVLPRVDSSSAPSEKGHAKHAFMANLQTMTRDNALALVPAEYRELCEAIRVEDLPLGGEFMAEVALVYDVETEEVRHLGFDIGRNYGKLAPTEIAMSIDVGGIGAEFVYAGDYKTGMGRVVPARRNWQLKLAALALSRWKGKSTARVAIIRVDDSGEPVYDSAEFDEYDLMGFASELRVLAARIKAEEECVRVGVAARASTGDHCRYCPSFTFCPAQTAIIRQLASEPDKVANSVANELTPETAARAYERVKLVREVMRQAEAALYAYASEHPIALGDGDVFGPVERSVEALDPEVVREVLAKMHGGDIAEKACTFETSKAGLERAVRTVYERRKAAGEKVTIKALVGEALDAVRDAGGVATKVRKEVREHHEGPAHH